MKRISILILLLVFSCQINVKEELKINKKNHDLSFLLQKLYYLCIVKILT